MPKQGTALDEDDVLAAPGLLERPCMMGSSGEASNDARHVAEVLDGIHAGEHHGLLPDAEEQHDPSARLTDDQLRALQETTLHYYLKEVNPDNGLIGDCTQPGAPCSIAAVGMALASAPAAVERQIRDRRNHGRVDPQDLRFFADSRQGTEPDATGYKGFYYHFLDMQTGRRVWNCEVSTIDSAFLFAGMLAAATYFDRDDAGEREIVALANRLYRRADWNWARNGDATVTHGWRPKHGFFRHQWKGYDESLLLYVLGLGSPTYPLPRESYAAYVSGHNWKNVYGYEYLYSGPLFTHQLSHMWIDFRGIQDDFMREHGIDYFENSRRATYVHQQYAIQQPARIRDVREALLGNHRQRRPRLRSSGRSRASSGNSSATMRGACRSAPTMARSPPGPWSPRSRSRRRSSSRPSSTFRRWIWACSSLTASSRRSTRPFRREEAAHGWVAPYHIGIDQGPVGLMIENYRSGFLWKLMRRLSVIVRGLRGPASRGDGCNRHRGVVDPLDQNYGPT